MLPEHLAVVHFVDVVAGEDEHVLRLLGADGVDVLVDGVGRAHVPVGADALHGRQDLNELAEFLGDDAGPAFADVPVERQRLVLGEDVDAAQIGIDAVGKGDVDDAVLAAKGNRRLGAIARERKQPFAGSARQKYAQSVFHRHDRLSRLLPDIRCLPCDPATHHLLAADGSRRRPDISQPRRTCASAVSCAIRTSSGCPRPLSPASPAIEMRRDLQKVQILRGEGSLFLRVPVFVVRLRGIQRTLRLLLHLVQPDGRFQHEHHLKALAANIGDDAGNLRRLGHALVNRLAQLLNQFAEFLIQVGTSISRQPEAHAPVTRFSYLIF